MQFIFGIAAAVAILVGILIRLGKADVLLGLFVTKYKEKKDNYNLSLLRKFVSNVLFFCAVCFGILLAGELLRMKWMMWIGIALFVIAAFYSVRYTEMEENFKKEGL